MVVVVLTALPALRNWDEADLGGDLLASAADGEIEELEGGVAILGGNQAAVPPATRNDLMFHQPATKLFCHHRFARQRNLPGPLSNFTP